jgi:hypothetical protein
MADEQQQDTQHDEQGGAVGKGTAVKAAAAAAATSVAAVAATKAFSHRGGSNGQSSNGGSGLGDAGSVMSSVLSSGWEAARDALVPAAEDAAGAAGEYLAKNGPDFVRERIIPKFIDSFNEARAS